MKAMDDALIKCKEVQLRVSDCQRLLDEKRRAEKRQKCCNSLINLKRDKDFRLAHSILNSNNSTMNNSNNTTNTSHNSSTTTTSSIVNNSNNSTNTTTTSSNNSGDSNCNNIHNNNINIHDTMQKGWIRIKVCLYNNSMTFLHADEWSLSSFPWHISSTSSLLWSRSGSSFFGHVSCLCRSIFYNPTVTNSMMLSTIVGMFTSGSQNSLNEYLNLLYRNIFFGAQAFATTIGLLHSSRLFRFTFLVALFVKVTIHSLIMSPSGMRSRGIWNRN